MKWLTGRGWGNLGIAALLFAAIFVFRVTVGSLADAISFLYVIPVVLVATARGTRAGLAAGAIAFLLSSVGALIADAPASVLGYLNRAIVYLFVGGLIGRFATNLRALEAESARHYALSQDMICVVGFDGYFKRVNPAFERILGYTEADLLGRPYREFVHPEDRAKTEEEVVLLSEDAGASKFQNRYFDKAGAVRWLEWTSTPLWDEGVIYTVARDVTDRKALEAELERLSQRDSLTGLFNRRRFEEELRRLLAYARRYGRGGALLLLDLDRFKRINDELGHAAGDEALRAVARALRENLRVTDTIARVDAEAVVARLGGDEFVVLLPEVDRAGAEAVATRLVEALQATELVVDGQPVELRISVGIALFDEQGLPGEVELLAAADRSLYEVKAGGGNAAALL